MPGSTNEKNNMQVQKCKTLSAKGIMTELANVVFRDSQATNRSEGIESDYFLAHHSSISRSCYSCTR